MEFRFHCLVVRHQPLAPATVAAIARRALVAALAREGLTRRGVQVDYSDDVVARLAALGFGPRYGARPLKRAIEHQVVGPIAQLLAARTATPPRGLVLSVRGDGIAIDVRE